MTEFQHESTGIVALVLMGLILVFSLFFWLWHKPPWIKGQSLHLMPLDLRFLDFSILLWAVVMIYSILLMVLPNLLNITQEDFEGSLGASAMVFQIVLQLSIFGTLLAFRLSAKSTYHYIFGPYSDGWARSLKLAVLRLVQFWPIIWIGNAASYMILKWLGMDEDVQQAIEMIYAIENNWVFLAAIVSAALLAPFVEELLFRGVIYRYLKSRIAITHAIVISSLVFSLLHFHPPSFFAIFLLGIILALVYEETQDIRAPVIMHLLHNAFTVVLITIDKLQ